MPEQKDPNNQDRDQNANGRNKPRQGGPGGSGRGPNQPGNGNFMSRGILGWVLLGGLAIALLLLMSNQQNQAQRLTHNEFYNLAERHRDEGGGIFKEAVEVRDDRIVAELTEAAAGELDSPPNNRVYTTISTDTKAMFVMNLRELGVDVEESPGGNALWSLMIMWGPVLLIILLIYFFVFRSLRGAGGGPGGMLGNFSRSKHKVMNKEHSTIRLNDVAGIEEAKDEVNEIIEFLKNPKKFQRLGGRVPRGVLLIGSPGCGKTLLAKAVAGEAEVPFFSISGSDFVEMFVGVGASRVRDLFKQAKESSPCIIFLDEIDAVGRKRGSGFSSGGHDEREQTLNAILVEMDGFDSSDQIIVMAATNRADVLDPALTRPGRFDRQIHVSLPDIKGRMEILKVHSKKIKVSPDVNLERLARGTPMFSGADLAAIINEAAIIATMQGKEFVEQDDLEEARDKVKWGRARKSHKIEEDEKKVIAYHEAGHAIVMFYDDDSEPLHKVTIIPRGQALGTTFMLPEKDKHIISRKQLIAQMRVCFGGRIAEEMCTGDQYNGTAGDIRQASAIARAMVTEYGMSEKMGFLLYGADENPSGYPVSERSYSDDTARMIDEEVKSLIDVTYSETKQLLKEHYDQLDALAKALLKYETLTYDEVSKIMRGETLDKATVSDLLEAEREKAKPAEGGTIRPDNAGLDNDTPGAWPSPA
ncbi:ATP-dependent zinc metalloprotease FtsH [Phycisphaerales bacterium AB-hyl4]|uniref:ATP-dependent zinc metalloprotease FtsH n=1 Tax=Natronomicrosphaera hydrolytica TaxID=3242702 RepID=A0ABV4U6F9_9BACT